MFLFLGLCGKPEVNVSRKFCKIPEALSTTTKTVTAEPQHGHVGLLVRKIPLVDKGNQCHSLKHGGLGSNKGEAFGDLKVCTGRMRKAQLATSLALAWRTICKQ